ncbi:MAG: hypothetical protein ACLVCH_03475 [Roseburia inulinivorans]
MKLSAGICFLSGKSSFETILESANLARKYAKEHNITSGVVYIEKMRQTRDEQVLIATRFHLSRSSVGSLKCFYSQSSG